MEECAGSQQLPAPASSALGRLLPVIISAGLVPVGPLRQTAGPSLGWPRPRPERGEMEEWDSVQGIPRPRAHEACMSRTAYENFCEKKIAKVVS